MKTDFYKYKNNEIYSTCIECLNEKVKCEFCNEKVNKIYLSKHIKRCIIEYNNFTNDNENHNDIIFNNEINNDIINLNNDNTMFNRTLIVGPSFCGKTHFFKQKQLIQLDNPAQQIKIIIRSQEQYENTALFGTQLEDVSVKKDLEDRTIQDFQNCCVVFDDM